MVGTKPKLPALREGVEEESIFSLPTDEIVRKAVTVLSERSILIVWGSLLDQHLGLTRIQKHFTFLVPDDDLEALSAALTSMHLPVATPQNYLLLSEGDFLRRGHMHRVSRRTDPHGIQCIHLMPASLPAYVPEELEPTPLRNSLVTLYAPRPSAVYAGIFRMMLKYRRHCAERRVLQSDLELLVNYNLLGLDNVKGFAMEASDEALGMNKRIEAAVERIRSWGKAGEWRPGEEWIEELLVAVVKGETDIGDLPSLDKPRTA
ncbi:hypothetical protein C8Q76DRAFT_676939 [Earliella scabrosa]|nr:hypothetical protein C8Q76DRAFT_676939 [Earliella scabrosa]